MSGSGASNLGYGSTFPNSNVDPAFVNSGNTSYAGNFGSNEIPSSAHSMRGVSWNVAAANGSFLTGGRKTKRKRKNITKMYKKMRRSMRSMRKRTKKTMKRGGKVRETMRKRGARRVRRYQRGGTYKQFMSNVPDTPAYSLGGPLSPNLSAMASPPPYQPYDNCPDNYNHYAATQKM